MPNRTLPPQVVECGALDGWERPPRPLPDDRQKDVSMPALTASSTCSITFIAADLIPYAVMSSAASLNCAANLCDSACSGL